MGNTATLDRYLCAILARKEKYFCVRSVDVAHFLGCSRATVSAVVRQLTETALLRVGQDGDLMLTPEGEGRARRHEERRRFFLSLLSAAGAEPAAAEAEAAALGQALSDGSFEKLKMYLAAQKQE
jgi:Mn-dependent DtxR family transcriptional regulator